MAALPAEPAPSGLLVSVPGSRAETDAGCSDRLDRMDALLAAAKSVNEPGLVQHVEKLQRRLSRLTVGASTSLEEVGAPLARQAEDRRLRRSEHARTAHFDALVAQQRLKTKVERARLAVKMQARTRARALKCALASRARYL